MYAYPKSEDSLLRWMLLALAPGLVCDALGVLTLIVHSNDLSSPLMWLMLLVPPVGLGYLIVLGGKYVEARMASSSVLFVLGYAFLNTFLWGAGCLMIAGTVSTHP
jgi:hypothetical protein